MAEWKRVLWSKKHVLLIGILLMMNVLFGYMQCNETQDISRTGEALEAYVEGYPDYIERTVEQAENMATLGLLSNRDSYLYRNIEKTVRDFTNLRHQVLEVGENRGVVLFGQFELTDFLLLGYGIYLILMFTGEYRKGLSLLVFSTPKGRGRLGVARLGILITGLFGMTLLLYGCNVALVNHMYPGMQVLRALQSIPEFQKCTFEISILEYLLFVVGIKYLACITACLLLYACISHFRGSGALVVFGGVFLGEMLLYYVLLPTSSLNYLKFLNVYALLKGNDGFLYYYNMNCFGRPVTLLFVQLLVCVVVSGIGFLLTIWGLQKKPFEGFSFLRRIADAWKRFIQGKKSVGTPFFWEGRKILVSQYGFFIILAVFYLALSSAVKTGYRDFRNQAEVKYYKEFAGPITEKKLKEINKLETKNTKYYNNSVKNRDKFNEEIRKAGGEVPDSVYSGLAEAERNIAKFEYLLPALRKVQEQMQTSYEYMQKTGKQLSLIEPFAYDMLLHLDYKTYARNLLYSFLGMILVLSGVMTVERTANMKLLLASQWGGRGRVLRNKILWTILLSIAISLPIHMIQFIRIGKVFPYMSVWEPIQSLPMLQQFPLQVSIRGYLILIYLYRSFLATLCGTAVLWISSRCKNRVNCIVICLMFLFLGTLLM